MNKELLSYIESARQNISLGHSISDRDLSEMLGLNPSAVNQWRKRGTYPTDETMVFIAIIGKRDIGKALMDLNSWRNGTTGVSIFYKIIGDIIGGRNYIENFIEKTPIIKNDEELSPQEEAYRKKITDRVPLLKKITAVSIAILISITPIFVKSSSNFNGYEKRKSLQDTIYYEK